MKSADAVDLSYKGSFFFPDKPEDVVTGTLIIDAEGVGQLELLGAFSTDGFLGKRELVTIWGMLFNGDKVSLIESYRGKSVYRSKGSEVNYEVGTTVIGTHIVDRDEAVFNTISAEIDHLQEWLRIDGGKVEFTFDFKKISYHYEQPVDIDFKIDEELNGSIFFRSEFWDGRDFDIGFVQRVRVELESSVPKSANQFINSLLSLRQLVSIFIGQQVTVKQIVLTSPNIEIEVIDPSPNRQPSLKNIVVYFKPGQKFTSMPERMVPLVRYADVAPQFEEIIGNWYKLLATELRPMIFILLDALSDHTSFEEADFLHAWQGVEAFHRIVLQDTDALKEAFKPKLTQILEALAFDNVLQTWTKEALYHKYEPVAKERLRNLITENQHLLPDTVTDDQITVWVREMGNTRNYLTHFDPKEKKKKVGGRRLYQYTTLLNWLLVVLILKRLGLNEYLLKNLSKHQHLYLPSLLRE